MSATQQSSGRRRTAANPSASSSAWMITFTDLVALLLAFFVMLFAMSKVDLRKWQNLTDALAWNLDAVREIETAVPKETLDAAPVHSTPGQDLDYLGGVLKQLFAEDETFADGAIRQYGDRVVVTLPADDRPSAPAGAVNEDALFHVAGVLGRIRNRIELVGTADAAAVSEAANSGWERALRFSLRAAEGLRRAGYDGDVIVRAYSLESGGADRVDLIVRLDARKER